MPVVGDRAIYGLDLAGNCTFCNPACIRFLGLASPEDLLGKNFHALCHHTRPDGRPYSRADCRIFRAYLRNTARINNWDLVDCSAAQIVGAAIRGSKHEVHDDATGQQ